MRVAPRARARARARVRARAPQQIQQPTENAPRHANQPPLNDEPPPPYSPSDISIHAFTPDIEAFLREIDVGPRALGRIGDIRNFECVSWKACFIEAGLLDSQAVHLEQLFMDSLTTEQGFILLAASDDM